MAGKASEVRALVLAEDHIEIVRAVGAAGGMRSTTLAAAKGIPPRLAAARLNRLYAAGYLNRQFTSAKVGGGVWYVYTVRRL